MKILKSEHLVKDTKGNRIGHSSKSLDESQIKQSFGSKVHGLNEIPPSWVPPYIALSTEYFDSWIQCENQDLSSTLEILPFEDLRSIVDELLDYWDDVTPPKESRLDPNPDQVIVRSSALFEDLNSRGEFLSEERCDDIHDIQEAIFKIWRHAYEKSNSKSKDFVLGIIIQPKIPRSGVGHLSNERRVSRISTNWSIEWEHGKSDRTSSHERFSVLKINPTDTSQPLVSSSQEEVKRKLKEIAAWSVDKFDRSHYEWIWNGSRLWLVQLDIEEVEKQPAPGSEWPYEYPTEFNPDLNVLKKARKTDGRWDKTYCLEVFDECELNCPDLYVLEGSDIESYWSDETSAITDSLRDEIQTLMEAPVVVRTDVNVSDGSTEILAPRSDALIEADEVLSFISREYIGFKERGYDPSQFCFLIHHFMVSKASALARSSPGDPKVSIDGIWGIPDGLNCYPHDSFRVDIDQERIGFSDIRCKDRYLDVNSEGDFIERTAGRPWDWKTSISDGTLFSIAKKARTIANHEADSVIVMFFIDLGIEGKVGESIPWFFWSTEKSGGELSSAGLDLWTSTIRIRSEDDLRSLKGRAEEITATDAVIEFDPDPTNVRNTSFIEDLAKFAEDMGVPILMNGSVLSHAYYILRRSGVQVQTTYDLGPTSQSRRFSKLVRDKIPVKIRSGGEETHTYEVPPDDLVELLKAKAVEEALEFSHTETTGDEVEELADLLEIIRSYTEVMDSSMEEIQTIADDKRQEKGGFTGGIVLVSTRDQILTQASLEEGDESRQPRLPTPLFPDPKIREDLKPRQEDHETANSIIEAPLIPPPLRGLEETDEFRLPELDLEVELRYEEDHLIFLLNRKDPEATTDEQSVLNDFL